MHESRAYETFNEKWHSNIPAWATVGFHTTYCLKTYGSPWNVSKEFCISTSTSLHSHWQQPGFVRYLSAWWDIQDHQSFCCEKLWSRSGTYVPRKECLDVLLPHLTQLCNVSIQSGCLPLSQKTAMVTPRLKKSGLDPADIKNYRPISNLPFMSKVIEKLILAQLTRYLTANGLFPKFQSGFRRYHSTETAVLRVLSDIYSAIDQDQVSLLALLDVSAAFDTVDHGILLERLSTSYGLSGMAYTWLESYITGRAQIIHVGNRHSPPSKVLYGVPQGSVLGPVLYVLYTSDVAKLVEALGLGTHLYADDTQLYGHCSPSNSFELASRVLRAIDSIHEWMSSNRLSLNTGKTQFIWLGTKHSLAKRDTDRLSSLLPSLTELTSVRNLGFIIDQELNMKDHITKLCQSC